MPSQETSARNQWAVLWTVESVDGYGEPLISSATGISLRVRWNTKWAETLDAQGQVVALDALVIVNRTIPIGSIMWLGKLSLFSDAALTNELHQVVTYSEVKDVKGRMARRKVGLKRFKANLPQVAS